MKNSKKKNSQLLRFMEFHHLPKLLARNLNRKNPVKVHARSAHSISRETP